MKFDHSAVQSSIARQAGLEPASNYIQPHAPRRTVRPLAPGEEPALGAHLVTPWLGFAHHGIYVGDGHVVHYGALVYDIIRKPVEEVSLENFALRRPVFVVEHDEECFEAAEVIRRARSRLGENRYRLLSNNCEHFCEWCLHDAQRSFQVQIALAFPRLMGEWLQAALLRFARRMLLSRRSLTPPAPVAIRQLVE